MGVPVLGGRSDLAEAQRKTGAMTLLIVKIGSISAIVNNNRGVKESGFLITFTLKDLPRVSQSLNNAPSTAGVSQMTQF